MLADDYALTHTPVFRHSGDAQPRKGNSDNLPSGGYLFGGAHDSQVAQPATIVRKKGMSFMSECRVLQKEEPKGRT